MIATAIQNDWPTIKMNAKLNLFSKKRLSNWISSSKICTCVRNLCAFAMPRVRLIAFWMVIGCACCFGDSLPIDPSASASADQSPIANQLFTLTQQQSVSGTADLLDTRPNLSFLRMRQLVELQRWSKRVQKAMRTLERGLQDPSVSRDQLMGFQRHVTKLVKSMDRRISKYLRQSANLDKVGASSKQIKQQVEHSSNELDPIDQQLSSTNNLKMIHGPNFFFSSSSSSSVSPPHFWRVDASASTIRPSSSNGSGSSFSTFTPSSDSLSSDSPSSSPPPSSNTSSSANSLDLSRSNTNHSSNSSSLYDNSFKIVTNSDKVDLSASEQHPSNRSLNVIERLSEIVNSTNAKLGETLDNARIKSKIDRFAGGFIGALNGLIASQDQTVNGEKQSFLLYHKCSEGYLQLADNGSLKTEIKSNLMGKSEFILHYLSKPNNHQLQIQAQDGRYVCFSAQGRPEVMVSWFCLIIINL